MVLLGNVKRSILLEKETEGLLAEIVGSAR